MINSSNQLIVKVIKQQGRRTKLHETIQLHILHHWHKVNWRELALAGHFQFLDWLQ